MTLNTKKSIIAALGFIFLLSLVFVQWMEVLRREQEAGRGEVHVNVPASSKQCVDCHTQSNPGIIEHWKGSTHAQKGVGCIECHQAEEGDVDGFNHYGRLVAIQTGAADDLRRRAP